MVQRLAVICCEDLEYVIKAYSSFISQRLFCVLQNKPVGFHRY